ncbi:SpoIIE family protein phosphatase [Alkalibacter rhizosphaerae]|uniref:SpoIIE family protein phosphatase n=1 Tax=Alkalibacter rhizosphaerae TaxID=2815577 RepID=A0A975AIZ9_9FIRM|nr:SpoIIE family protein phosphatase [Alkalibacter rhizosphaerae]QSX09055.1 SpoIIE family protein phosphatase [Alkalibacter rhizosphaerae]
MNYVQDVLRQEKKNGQRVCGDVFLMERSREYTLAVLCDGIGSGIYANIAATTCASRLLQLAMGNMSTQAAALLTAESMHRARKEAFPFAAFTLAKIFSDGHYTIHTYESPVPLVVADGMGFLPAMTKLRAGKEWVEETAGILYPGDGLMLFTDGVSQAGMGRGYPMGVGEKRISDVLNYLLDHDKNEEEICDGVMELVFEKCGGVWEDDTTLAFLKNREGKRLVIMTGPPSNPSMDREYVLSGMEKDGWKVVCGSSTADIVSRVVGQVVEKKDRKGVYGSIPEYRIQGLDVVSEGALVLNRVCNILEDSLQEVEEPNVVEKISLLMQQADRVDFLVGGAYNDAHGTLDFKEMGVMPRNMIVRILAKKLKAMGKIVEITNY